MKGDTLKEDNRTEILNFRVTKTEKELIEMYASTNKAHTHNHLVINSLNFKTEATYYFGW